jgi:hypothetical protein
MISLDAGLAGLSAAQDRLDAAAARLAQGRTDPELMAGLLLARTQAAAAAAVIRVEDEVSRRLVDLLA